jgi:hypothetical protein
MTSSVRLYNPHRRLSALSGWRLVGIVTIFLARSGRSASKVLQTCMEKLSHLGTVG